MVVLSVEGSICVVVSPFQPVSDRVGIEADVIRHFVS